MGFMNVLAATLFLCLTVSLIGTVVGVIDLVSLLYTSPQSFETRTTLRFTTFFLLLSIILSTIMLFLRRYTVSNIVEAFLVVAIAWIVIPTISAMAYRYSIGMDFVNAFFESLSGFTGTGLSVISKPEEMPSVILLWRAVTQWVGELGVVVFAGTLLPALHRVIRSIYVVERGERIAPTVLSTMRRLVGIYVFYTALGVVLFILSGMSVFDALAHSMTAIATGGMSTNSLSIGYWFRGGNWAIYVSTMVIMVLGALNFVDHVALLRGRFREFVSSIEVRWFFILLTIFTIPLIALPLMRGDVDEVFTRFYHLVSGYTTTGFQLGSSDVLKNEPDYVKMILALSMIVGGATFSTAGGIKIKRAAILIKALVWESARLFAPPAMVLRRRVGRELIGDTELISVYNFVAIYMVTFISIALFIHLTLLSYGYTEFTFIDSMFETASALSCVGLSVGITSATSPLPIKIALMIAMYLGRLEFAALYLFLGYSYVRRVVL